MKKIILTLVFVFAAISYSNANTEPLAIEKNKTVLDSPLKVQQIDCLAFASAMDEYLGGISDETYANFFYNCVEYWQN